MLMRPRLVPKELNRYDTILLGENNRLLLLYTNIMFINIPLIFSIIAARLTPGGKFRDAQNLAFITEYQIYDYFES